jgi:hypothetical protein
MKILLVLGGLLVAAAAGAASAALIVQQPQPASPAVSMPTAAPSASAPASNAERARIDQLEMEVANLQLQIAELRSSSSRSPITEPEPAPQTAALAPSVVVTPAQRDAILQVLADQKAAEERERELARQRREEEQRLQRADRMAQRFGLNEAQEAQLASFYDIERQRFEELRKQFQDGGGMMAGDREQMRATFQEARDWRTGELVRMFGETGQQIADYESERFRGGGFGQMDGGGAGAGPQGGAQVIRRRGGQGGQVGGAPDGG